MATMEGATGWEETSTRTDDSGSAMAVDGAETPRLGFSEDEVVDAALVQDEIDYAAHMAVSEEAAMRHFGKDPRDML